MADINIQRKKTSSSPWLLVLLALAVVGGIAWYLLRTDNGSTQSGAETSPIPAAAPSNSTPESNLSAADSMMLETPEATLDALTAATEADPSRPEYARNGLRILSALLVNLSDRADLRDPAVNEKRDVLTSATARLDDPTTSPRPGFIAATGLMQAMQQKAYPALEVKVGDLLIRASQLSGRSDTAEDQQQLREFFTRATDMVRTLSEPST